MNKDGECVDPGCKQDATWKAEVANISVCDIHRAHLIANFGFQPEAFEPC